MRVLVTGADGFVGKHLCAHLRDVGDEVIAMCGPGKGELHVDVMNLSMLEDVIGRSAPEAVVHLAGVSFVGQSHASPGDTFCVNAVGAVNLLDAIRKRASKTRVLLVGSGEMYGPLFVGDKADESYPLLPTSPYSAAKVAAEVAGFQFHRSYGLAVLSARPFNHLGPGQGSNFAIPSFATQICEIKLGLREPRLAVGDLTPIRDFSHVSDVVRAYRLILANGEPGQPYNIASGIERSMRSIVEELFLLAGVQATIEIDPERVRPTELPRLVGDASKLRAIGWKPERDVSQALREVLDERFAALSKSA